MEFRFIREGDTFTWQNSSYKLVFSEPRIQPWDDEHKKIYSENDIMYYYYHLDTYSCNNGIWEKISSIMAYDFPAIFRLLDLVDYMLRKEPDQSDGSDIPNGVSEEHDTNYWLREDYYSIKAFSDVSGEVHYEVYAGTDYKGFRVVVNEWELYELKKCAEAFVQFSIDSSNKLTNDRNTANRQSFKVRDGRLYEHEVWYSKERDCFIVDEDTVNESYSVGDVFESICILLWEGEHYYSESYNNKTVSQITEDKLMFTDGSSVNIGDILYVYRP